MSEEVVHQLRELGEDVDLLRLAEHYRIEALKTRRTLRRVFERINKRELLSGAVGAWLQVAEEARKRRREGLFEALGGQLQAAKRRCTAWEGVLYSRPAILEAFSNWRLHCRQRRRRGRGSQTALKLADASRSICLLRTFASWRSSCFRDAKRRNTTGNSGEPARSRSASSTPGRTRLRPTFSLSTNVSGASKEPPRPTSLSSMSLRSRFESVLADSTPVKSARVHPGALAASPAGPASETSSSSSSSAPQPQQQQQQKADAQSKQVSGCPEKQDWFLQQPLPVLPSSQDQLHPSCQNQMQHQAPLQQPLQQHHQHPRFFGPVPVLNLASNSHNPPIEGTAMSSSGNERDDAGQINSKSSSSFPTNVRGDGDESNSLVEEGEDSHLRDEGVDDETKRGYCCAPFDLLDDDSTRHTETPDITEEACLHADTLAAVAPSSGVIGGPLAISFADFLKGHLAEDPEVQVLSEGGEDDLGGAASPFNCSAAFDNFGDEEETGTEAAEADEEGAEAEAESEARRAASCDHHPFVDEGMGNDVVDNDIDNDNDNDHDDNTIDENDLDDDDEDHDEGDYDYDPVCDLDFQSPSVSSSTMLFDRMDAEAEMAMQRVESSPSTSIGSASRSTLLSARRHEAAQRRLTKSATFAPGTRVNTAGIRCRGPATAPATVPRKSSSKTAVAGVASRDRHREPGGHRASGTSAVGACSSAPPPSSSSAAAEKAGGDIDSSYDDEMPKRKGGTSVFSRLQDPSHYTGVARYGGPSLKDTAVGNAKDSLNRWAGDLRETSKRRGSLPGMIYGVGMGREASLASLGKSEGGCRTPGSAHRNILSSASVGSSCSVAAGGTAGTSGQANSGLSSHTPR